MHLEDPADKASDEPIEIPDIVLSQLDLETSEVLGNEITKEEEIFSEEPGADPFKPVTQVQVYPGQPFFLFLFPLPLNRMKQHRYEGIEK